MHTRPCTQQEIIKLTGLCNSTVSRWLGVLHATPNNLVYISGWTRKGTRGNYTARWSTGFCMQDVPKPKPLTQAQYAKNWRARKAREARIIVDQQTGVTTHVST